MYQEIEDIYEESDDDSEKSWSHQALSMSHAFENSIWNVWIIGTFFLFFWKIKTNKIHIFDSKYKWYFPYVRLSTRPPIPHNGGPASDQAEGGDPGGCDRFWDSQ